MGKEIFKRFRKKNASGMHVSYFREGTIINGQRLVVPESEEKVKALIRPGNTIVCVPEDIGAKHLSQFEAIGAGTPLEEVDNGDVAPTLELLDHGNGWFDIVNPDYPDTPINKKKLRKAAAEQLLSELTEGEAKPSDDLGDKTWEELIEMLEELGVEELDPEWEDESDLIAEINRLKAE